MVQNNKEEDISYLGSIIKEIQYDILTRATLDLSIEIVVW